MTWDYRVVRAVKDEGGQEWLAIHEVHYDAAGKPISATANAIAAAGHNLAEVSWALLVMGEALRKPVLDLDEIGKPSR